MGKKVFVFKNFEEARLQLKNFLQENFKNEDILNSAGYIDGASFTSVVHLYVRKEDEEEVFEFDEGMQSAGGEYYSQDQFEFSGMVDLVQGVKSRIAERKRNLPGATLDVIFYTLEGVISSPEINLQQAHDFERMCFTEKDPDAKRIFKNMARGFREDKTIERGLNPTEIKDFERLYFGNGE